MKRVLIVVLLLIELTMVCSQQQPSPTMEEVVEKIEKDIDSVYLSFDKYFENNGFEVFEDEPSQKSYIYKCDEYRQILVTKRTFEKEGLGFITIYYHTKSYQLTSKIYKFNINHE